MRTIIKVTGIKEIDNALRAMKIEMADKTLQLASVAAAKPLITKAKLLAPEGPTGNTIDSIGAVKGSFNQVKSLQREIGEVTVGPRRGRYKGYAAHLIEYGTRPRMTKGKGKIRKVKNAYRGTTPKKPFMEPAFNATRNLMLQRYNVEAGKKVLAAIRRTIKG
jgi:hypothetical protein